MAGLLNRCLPNGMSVPPALQLLPDAKYAGRKRILVAHCRYQQGGGEDGSFELNAKALARTGAEVFTLEFSNSELLKLSNLQKLQVGIWNQSAYAQVKSVCKQYSIQEFHVHNTFPYASPIIHLAAKNAGAITIQWLHNYRLICPAATCFRNGCVCTQCLGRPIPWPSLLYKCYRDNFLQTFGAAAIQLIHKNIGSYKFFVDYFVALTNFSRDKFVENGLPKRKVIVIPNHLAPDPGKGSGDADFCLFVGRLSPEKGIADLLASIDDTPNSLRIKIYGSGPLEHLVRRAATRSDRIEYCGQGSSDTVISQMKKCKFLVFPSVWYEGLPRTIIEAFATGTPVIGARLGAMEEIILHEENGLHYQCGDTKQLAAAMTRLCIDEPFRQKLRAGARKVYELRYTYSAIVERLSNVALSREAQSNY